MTFRAAAIGELRGGREDGGQAESSQSPEATRPNCRFLPPPGVGALLEIALGETAVHPKILGPIVGNCRRMAHFSYTLPIGNALLGLLLETFAKRWQSENLQILQAPWPNAG